MDRKNHEKVDLFFWDKKYSEVHQWLDATFPKYAGRNPYRHWLERHHIKAIKEKFGEFYLEYNVAYLHILADYLSHHQIAFVPVDEKEAEAMLKSLGVL
jgi:hypothetical protein